MGVDSVMSADELLNVGESLSPLAAWKRRHMLVTVMEDPAIVGTEGPESGEVCTAFYCMKNMDTYPTQALDKIGRGDTEDEACADFAQRNGLHHWSVSEGKR